MRHPAPPQWESLPRVPCAGLLPTLTHFSQARRDLTGSRRFGPWLGVGNTQEGVRLQVGLVEEGMQVGAGEAAI